MGNKISQNNRGRMRDLINEWWDDLADAELDLIDRDQEQHVRGLQERYKYARKLPFMEAKKRNQW